MFLVCGATGMVGSEICRLLSEQRIALKVLVRATSDPDKVEKLKQFGAIVTVGDVRSPETLKSACQGVDKVICTVSALPFSYIPGVNDIEKVDRQGIISLIDAAQAAGVEHFIYTSFSKNLDLEFPLRNAKRAVEKYLRASGLNYTILRPSCFMEVWLSPTVGFDAANAKAQIYGSGDQTISWISYKDVARYAVEAAFNNFALNNELELGGPEPVSPNRVVNLYEQRLGKHFEVVHVPVEALQGQYQAVDEPMQKSFIGLMMCYAAGDPIPTNGVLSSFKVKPVCIEEFVSQN
jgi:uncharacterized protein YbjT (DUF2867 family)